MNDVLKEPKVNDIISQYDIMLEETLNLKKCNELTGNIIKDITDRSTLNDAEILHIYLSIIFEAKAKIEEIMESRKQEFLDIQYKYEALARKKMYVINLILENFSPKPLLSPKQ